MRAVQSDKDVAAKVNGEDGHRSTELNTQVEQLKKQYPTMFTGADGEGRLLDFKQRLLDNLINQKLVEQAAKDKGIKVTDADVETQIEQLKAGFKDDGAVPAGAQERRHGRRRARSSRCASSCVTQKLIEKLSTDAARPPTLRSRRTTRRTRRSSSRRRPSARVHILFKAEDKATAEKVLAEVKAGGDFAALAKKYSQDPGSAANGGDLGWPTTPYVAEFEAALDKLEGRQISALVKTQYGWHIIKVTDERAGEHADARRGEGADRADHRAAAQG